MLSTHLGRRGTIVIPAAIRRRLGLVEGSLLAIEETADGVLLRPARLVPIDEERRRLFFEQFNAECEALKADPEA